MMEDDFAQSRGADDLFMDEFESPPNEPAGSYVEAAPATQPSPKPAQLSAENVERHTQAHYDQQAYQQQNQNGGQGHGGRGGRRGRGRGGNGQQGNNPVAGRQNNPRREQGNQGGFSAAVATAPISTLTQTADAAAPPVAAAAPDEKPAQLERVDDTIASIAAPTGPAVQHRVQAVRGDRSATGPAKPKKRTEAEITELMAKMKLKSSAAAEAHERTKKDQAASEQREREAARERAEKVVKERQNVRAMDSERARNAARKQKAMQGREWDEGKTEGDLVDKSRGGSSRYMKGANGGVARDGGRDVVLSSGVGERMELAKRAVRGVEEEFPPLGVGLSGARGAAGRGGGIGAKMGGRDLFPNGPGQPAGRGGRGGGRGGGMQPARGGVGLGASRFADEGDEKKESGRSANTDIRLEEKRDGEVKGEEKGKKGEKKEEKKIDLEQGKKELEVLKQADEGKKTSWAEEANEAA